jgi:RNA polymerase sigma-70 factor, ECF subfamily
MSYLQTLKDHFGFVPKVFRAQDSIGHVVEAESAMVGALLAGNALSREQKEQIALEVSAVNRSPYGFALHKEMCQTLGATENDETLASFARKLILRPAEFGRGDVEALRHVGFTEVQILEAILTAGVATFLNTIAAGLRCAPEFAHPMADPAVEKIVYLEASCPRPTLDPVAPDPDRELVDRVRAGNIEDFEVLVQRHNQRVYRTLMGLLGNPEEAQDAAQDTFLKAFEHLKHFEGRAKFSTWLLSIASNAGLQRLRERRPMESLDDDGPLENYRPRQIRAWADNPEQCCSKEELRALVERSIMRLPAKYRVAVMLRDVEQLSTEEAAAALGLGVPALKARLLRGRLMLRETLTPHFGASA